MRSLSRAESSISRDSVFEKRGRATGNVLPVGAEDESASRKSVRAAFSLGRHSRWSGPASSPWRNSRRAGTCIGGRRGETLAEGTFVGAAPLLGWNFAEDGGSRRREPLVGGGIFPGGARRRGIPVGAAARRAVRFVPAVIRLPVFLQYETFRRMPER